MSIELWKPIQGYEGIYEISSLLNVKSLPKKVIRGKYNAVRNMKEKLLSTKTGDVTLVKNKVRKTFDVNTLYMIAFEGYVQGGKRKRVLLNVNDKIVNVSRRKICQIIKSRQENKTSTYTGVSKMRHGKYRAKICIDKTDVHLGVFLIEKEAKIIYDRAVKNEHLYQGNAKDFRIQLYSM